MQSPQLSARPKLWVSGNELIWKPERKIQEATHCNGTTASQWLPTNVSYLTMKRFTGFLTHDNLKTDALSEFYIEQSKRRCVDRAKNVA